MDSLKTFFDDSENAEITNCYYGDDGIAYCNDCNTAKQVRITVFGRERVMPCMCQCEADNYKKELEEIRQANFKAQVARNRSNGLLCGETFHTFENVGRDKENSKALTICEAYTAKFDEMMLKNIGLKLYGAPGTGKTVTATCIANRLLDCGYRVFMATCSMIVNDIQKSFDKNELINDICSYDLLVIDDLGAERDTSTSRQYVFDIINRRLEVGKPLIITTNISEFQPSSVDEARMYSRLDKMTQPVRITGNDRRKDVKKEKLGIFHKIISGFLSEVKS